MANADVRTAVLDFWFGPPDAAGYGEPRKVWFNSTPAFDEEIRTTFGADLDAAVRGEHDNLRDDPRGALALVVLYDQFTRNMFRGTARAFATDEHALVVAEHAVARGFDATFPPVVRRFFYLPFEHSERLADQRRSVALHEPLCDTEYGRDVFHYVIKHLQVIERFGRFPHRNEALGRPSTPEEAEYLASGDRPY